MMRFFLATTVAVLIAVYLSAFWVGAQASVAVRFTDVTLQAGISFLHDNAASPRKYIIETMGSGGAWIDYDADGFLDLFLVNGGATPAYTPKQRLRHSLYHSRGDGTFAELAQAAGVQGDGSFGMGAAVADFDNDGLSDIYVTGYASHGEAPHHRLVRRRSHSHGLLGEA
jgi:hypothetical protein